MMISVNSETHVTQIEIQNEEEISRNTNSSINNLALVKYSELLRQENTKECIDNVNMDRPIANVHECKKLFTVTNVYKIDTWDTYLKKGRYNRKNKKKAVYPTKYWVLMNTMLSSDDPLDYSPDRNSFVAKVFSITFIMLSITAGFVAFVVTADNIRQLFVATTTGKLLLLVGTVGMLVLNYTVMCSPCIRMFPFNYVMLIFAVIFMSLIAAYITAAFATTLICYSLIATAVTVLVCLLLACTSFDFTKFMLYVFVITIAFSVLFLIVFLASVITGVVYRPLHIVLLFVGTLINVVVLIMELQMILGGRAVSLSEDDYALGAFLLYVSIIDLFLKLLQLLGIFLDDEGEFF